MSTASEPLTMEEEVASERPTKDESTRFAIDQAIRAIYCNGRQKYTIAARPDHGAPMWALAGTRLKFSQADVIRREKLRVP